MIIFSFDARERRASSLIGETTDRYIQVEQASDVPKVGFHSQDIHGDAAKIVLGTLQLLFQATVTSMTQIDFIQSIDGSGKFWL
jgi:hypothetical protein